MGLPAFSCTGRIVTPQTVTAAASWSYDCAHLPVVRVPDGTDFSAGMLRGGVPAFVNRDYAEFEETVPVVWDESTFPAEPERTLVTGAFAPGYTAFADDTPRCLVAVSYTHLRLSVRQDTANPTTTAAGHRLRRERNEHRSR